MSKENAVFCPELADELVAEMPELSKKKAEGIINALFKNVLPRLFKECKSVHIKGFGNFEIVSRPERQGRDPRKNVAITIPARNTIKFKKGSALKEL